MSHRFALLALGLLLLTAATLAPAGSAANECQGIQRCVPVAGPWVAVPAAGEVDFLLECPAAKGIVGGTDALVTSQAIGVSWDAIPGSPIGSGRTTNYEVLFRAISGNHRPGEFEPFIGCIPTQSSTRTTTAVPAHPLGPPLDLRATRVTVTPGSTTTGSMRCPAGEALVDSWTATAFATADPTALDVGGLVAVRVANHGQTVQVAAKAATELPATAHTLVQLGVRCGPA